MDDDKVLVQKADRVRGKRQSNNPTDAGRAEDRHRNEAERVSMKLLAGERDGGCVGASDRVLVDFLQKNVVFAFWVCGHV